MNPSSDLCVATMIRALSDVIIPSLDTSHGLAAEQAALVLGHLHVLRGQLDHIERFERLEYRAAATLGAAVLAATDAGVAPAVAVKRLRTALDRPVDDQAGPLRDGAEELRAAVEDVVRGSEGVAGAGGRVRALVLEHERETADNNRTWFGAMGWESGESRLGSIGQLLDDRLETATTEATA